MWQIPLPNKGVSKVRRITRDKEEHFMTKVKSIGKNSKLNNTISKYIKIDRNRKGEIANP